MLVPRRKARTVWLTMALRIISTCLAPTPIMYHRKSEEPSLRSDASEALDFVRILLAPVVKRQRERAERLSADKLASGGKKKPITINIPLHGPRVEVVLAWLGAVHLPELGYA